MLLISKIQKKLFFLYIPKKQVLKVKKQKLLPNITLNVCLKTTYLIETEIFLLKVLYIRLKDNWNSTKEPMNSTKKYNKMQK